MKKALLSSLCLSAAISFAPATSAADIKLYTFNCGEIDMNDLSLFARGGEFDGRTNKAGDACFLIRHPKGDLLWDTGLPKAIAEAEDGFTNGPYKLMLPKTLDAQLSEIGVSANDIDFVSISHSHFDHTGNLNDYAGATWIVHENEYADMFSAEKRANPQAIAAYDKLDKSEKIKFTGDHDVFGDGSVTILSLPGHTPGHTSLMVNLENSGPVLLSGDLYHLTESRELRTIPTFNTNVEDTLKSMDRFEKLAKESGARVIIQHEKDDTDKMPKLPGYLD
ncbi:N-acyl homoserine lactonase family protein [Kordiimonas aquimaris]|uniref:N-acyl homoserine lactonase family protein n=1 Tax=Kordiimonas aquimaris TaxID=707591 RepID=UPI0021CE9CBC|nr:N-acyl homoserine lactonase family protein [Kordiimonas aquimaris]